MMLKVSDCFSLGFGTIYEQKWFNSFTAAAFFFKKWGNLGLYYEQSNEKI